MTVLSPVEKLILYRKKYKISQKDLAGDSISRSHLAMIETGKNSLNDHTAEILVKNFNYILTSRGIDEEISYDELMETKKMQVEKLKNEFLKQLEDSENLETTVSEIESYASEYDADTKIMLYKKMGDLFYENENPYRATSFYLRIINDLIIKRDSVILGEISLTLVRIYLQTENYKAALDLENLIKSEINSFELKYKIIILYNLGILNNDFFKNHRNALNYFIEVESYVNDYDKIFDIKNCQALAYSELKEYDKAISIYRSLMLKYKDISYKLSINDNLLYISCLSNDQEKIKFYYRKCKHLIKEMLLSTNEEFKLEEILYSLSETALLLDRNKDVRFFLKELFLDRTERNILSKLKSIKNLLGIFTKKDFNEVKSLESYYFKLLKKEKNFSIGYSFIDYYNKYGNKNDIEDFLKKMNEFY